MRVRNLRSEKACQRNLFTSNENLILFSWRSYCIIFARRKCFSPKLQRNWRGCFAETRHTIIRYVSTRFHVQLLRNFCETKIRHFAAKRISSKTFEVFSCEEVVRRPGDLLYFGYFIFRRFLTNCPNFIYIFILRVLKKIAYINIIMIHYNTTNSHNFISRNINPSAIRAKTMHSR